ncbi:MAG: anaerobic ribonucleoside-triphosphate reductase activating protein [Fusobacteriota bacterium]
MKFSGLEKVSVVDYPKKVVATLFTSGCNFRCEYCHNGDLINRNEHSDDISEEEILEYLKKRRDTLDGICITGGEPTLYGNKLLNFITRVKQELGSDFLVKIDTNGSHPIFIQKNRDIVDFFAIDFKSLDYSSFSTIEREDVLKAIEEAKKARDYEVRCTMYPEYIKPSDFQKIAELLKGVKKVAIQQFDPDNVYIENIGVTPYTEDILRQFEDCLKEEGIKTELRI